MPKYLLLKHYRGGPAPHHPFPPMDQWAPEDVEAHMAFQRHVSELLQESGEYVNVQALTPAQTWVRYGGPDAAPVTTDGPHPETSDLIAGWYMIDVGSRERALELAAYVSSEPGPRGEALDALVDIGQGAQDENRRAVAGLAQRLDDVQPVDLSGQHPVHDNDVVGLAGREKHALAPVIGVVDSVAGLLQAFDDEAGHPLIVFDQ